MQFLLLVNNISQYQEQFVHLLTRSSITQDQLVLSTYQDATLFIHDNNYQLIFIEIDTANIAESVQLLTQIKQVNPTAIIAPILHSKDPDIVLALVKYGIDDILIYPFENPEIDNLIQVAKSRSTTVNNLNHNTGAVNTNQVILLSSYKGGTGVSTITANLGFCLAELEAINRKVLILDLANQSNHCARTLGCSVNMTINQLCDNIDDLGVAYITSQCTWVTDNLALIGSGMSIDSLVEGLNFDKLIQVINILSPQFEYILIDLPTHTFDARFLASIEVATQILLCSTLDITSIIDTKNYINVIKDLGIEINKLKILVNRYDAKTGIFKPSDLEKSFEHPISFYLHNDYIAATTACQQQCALLESDPNSRLSLDLIDIANGLHNGVNFVPLAKRTKMSAPQSAKSQSLFSGVMNSLNKFAVKK